MVEALKIAAKVALIAVVSAAIIALFANVQIPGMDFSVFAQALGKGLAIVNHWCPAMVIVWPVAIAMMSLQLAMFVFNMGAIAWRWVFKVNE